MRTFVRCFIVFLPALFLQVRATSAFSQSAANSGTVAGSVTDPSGAVVPGATVLDQQPSQPILENRDHRRRRSL